MDLDALSKIATIISSLSLLGAVLTYWYQKWKDKRDAVLEQIEFFRKEIVPKHDEFILCCREALRDPNYAPLRVKLDNLDIESFRNQYQAKKQAELFKNPKILSLHAQILNLLEQLSLMIIHSKTMKHQALNSIKYPFVESVEWNGTFIFFKKGISGEYIYSNVLYLYSAWKDTVDRTTEKERIEKFLTSLK